MAAKMVQMPSVNIYHQHTDLRTWYLSIPVT